MIATALPAIARDFGTSPIELKLALTSYLLALAIFIPVSGWLADRFGARLVFRTAIVVFIAGSILCGAVGLARTLVFARIVQGMGGAMMTPVGRLVLLRTVRKSELVSAMAWLTVPGADRPVVGPPLGGFLTTYFGWHWIFWINVPVGLLGIVLAVAVSCPTCGARQGAASTRTGFVLSGLGLAGLHDRLARWA